MNVCANCGVPKNHYCGKHPHAGLMSVNKWLELHPDNEDDSGPGATVDSELGTPVGQRTDDGILVTAEDLACARSAGCTTDEVILLKMSKIACRLADEWKSLSLQQRREITHSTEMFSSIVRRVVTATHGSSLRRNG